MIKALINGDWEKVPEANLKLGAPAFAYKAGLYETFRTLNYKPVFLDPHLDRLFQSANRIGLEIWFVKDEIRDMIHCVVSDFSEPDQRVRILAVPYNLIVYTSSLNIDDSIYRGVSVITVTASRNLPGMKTTDYRACLSAWEKAQTAHGFEAILCDKNHYIFEGSRSNVFWVKSGKLFTREGEVLPGITRQTLISKSPFPFSYGLLNENELQTINELFITNSGSGIVPVIRVNNRSIGNGKVGRITNNLLVCYDKWINQNIDKF